MPHGSRHIDLCVTNHGSLYFVLWNLHLEIWYFHWFSYHMQRNMHMSLVPFWAQALSDYTCMPQDHFTGPGEILLYPALQRSWKEDIQVSPCPSVRTSVRLSVCGQNRIRSISSTILIGSISYLHILSSSFRRCVACNVCFRIQQIEMLANYLKL